MTNTGNWNYFSELKTRPLFKIVGLIMIIWDGSRKWQELFLRESLCINVMVNPDFVKIAEGYDIEAKRVSERKDLKPHYTKDVSIQKTLSF